ncbi:hypothetical protein THRCLA_10937, partial [Thraustotheca clavata]
IRTEFASSTVLTIAHRLDTVLDCDRILVFDQGRLAQCDEPKELINAGEGIFFELCSEEDAGLLSRITFGWANALLRQGHERQLDPEDLWPLEPDSTCKNVSSVFEPKYKKSHSIVRTIMSLYGWRLLFVGILQALTLGCTLYGPVVLKEILTEVEGNHFDMNLVLGYVISLFVVKALQAVITAHANLENQIITIKITSALQHLLFQKALVYIYTKLYESSLVNLTIVRNTMLYWKHVH